MEKCIHFSPSRIDACWGNVARGLRSSAGCSKCTHNNNHSLPVISTSITKAQLLVILRPGGCLDKAMLQCTSIPYTSLLVYRHTSTLVRQYVGILVCWSTSYTGTSSILVQPFFWALTIKRKNMSADRVHRRLPPWCVLCCTCFQTIMIIKRHHHHQQYYWLDVLFDMHL